MNTRDSVWQQQDGEKTWWVFGKPVRGIVRHSLAEIYFDGEQNPSWIWMCLALKKPDGQMVRGACDKLVWAVEAAEEALRVKP